MNSKKFNENYPENDSPLRGVVKKVRNAVGFLLLGSATVLGVSPDARKAVIDKTMEIYIENRDPNEMAPELKKILDEEQKNKEENPEVPKEAPKDNSDPAPRHYDDSDVVPA